MASENGDPFAGGSPTAFGPVDSDNDEGLVGAQLTTDILDLDMLDSQQEPTKHSLIKKNDSKDCGRGTGTGALIENREAKMMGSEKTDRMSALLTDSAENDKMKSPRYRRRAHDQKLDPNDREANIIVKDEFPIIEGIPRGFLAGEVIDLSDSEEDVVVVKQEYAESPFNWMSMPDDAISISDDDDKGAYVVLDNGTEVPIKTENSDVEFLWSDMGNVVIDLDSDEDHTQSRQPRLGKSLLGRPNPRSQRTPADIARMQQLQKVFAAKALGRPIGNGAAGRLYRPQRAENTEFGDGDDYSWMSSDFNPDHDAAKEFRDLKRAYKAKKREDATTMEDDVTFEKARKAENIRLKRLELEYLNSRGDVSDADDDDEASEEESLFVSSSPNRSAKRRFAAMGEDGGDDANVPSQKRRRQNDPRTRKQDQTDFEHDLERSLMAGIEGYFRTTEKQKEKGKTKSTDEATKTQASKGVQKGKKNRNAKNLEGTQSWRRKSREPRKKKPTKAGYLNNASSLLTGNVFEYARANNNLAPLPFTTETNKNKSLNAMVENLPRGHAHRGEKAHIKRATVKLGNRQVVPDGNGGWSFKGMKTSLRHHQVQGAAWMKDRELGEDQPMGGILADGMGLGKTVMMIALMIAHPPPPHETYRSTLIADLILGDRELAKHSNEEAFTRIIKHHSGNRLCGKGAVDDLQRASVVLTTYGEVMKSYPKAEIPEGIDNEEKLREWWKTVWEPDRDLIHKARYFRIVLDESQAIKNHLSHTSIACRALMGRHRWALSGTPIMNRVEELYPYFKFLDVPGTGTYSEFRQNYCVEGSGDCNKRLHCLLDQIMVRRTMNDKVLGYPIVSLPQTHQETKCLDFNIVEQTIYSIVSRRFIRAINKASSKGELSKKPGYGIVMFLRLRQMAAHIFLIQDILQDMFEMDSVDRLEKATITEPTEENQPARDIVAALRRMVAAKAQPEELTPDRHSEETNINNRGDLVDKFGQKLRKLKESAKLEELKNEQLCQKCHNIPEDPWVTSCLHVYCKECLQFLAYKASMMDLDNTPCIKCGTMFAASQSCSSLKELAMEDFSDLTADLRGRKRKDNKVNMHWVDYDDTLVLSAKTIGVQKQIEKWLEEEPDKKIIVFSQFLMIMQILERLCQRKGWGYCNYNGKMSHKARDKTIAEFGKPNDIKVMIASLKCGGIGLNLTMASRVTCVDLWFNSCAEQQAFCRVWRIGQDDETFVTRFIIKNSVDDRLEQMQEFKDRIIGAAIDDRSVTSKLSPQEVMRLFGDVQFDKKTKRPFIALEDDEKLDAILPPVPNDEDDHISWKK